MLRMGSIREKSPENAFLRNFFMKSYVFESKKDPSKKMDLKFLKTKESSSLALHEKGLYVYGYLFTGHRQCDNSMQHSERCISNWYWYKSVLWGISMESDASG